MDSVKCRQTPEADIRFDIWTDHIYFWTVTYAVKHLRDFFSNARPGSSSSDTINNFTLCIFSLQILEY